MAAVTELLENGRYAPALALRLHTLAAFLSQTVAWHHFDQGHHTQASQNWIAGLHNAHAAGDDDMGADLLGDLAYRAAWRGEHTTATNILNHALTALRTPPPAACPTTPRPHPRRTGRPGRTARRAARPHRGGETPQRRRHRPARLVRLGMRSRSRRGLRPALLDLGDTGRALRLITEGECLLSPARDKTRGVFLACRAAGHLDLREPEPAEAATTESLLLARRIGTPRCAQLVNDLLPRFQHYQDVQDVPELLQLTAAWQEGTDPTTTAGLRRSESGHNSCFGQVRLLKSSMPATAGARAAAER
ncbi:hypothetical protein SHL15_8976 [Streptomyces hygroscopicus subsp. limoneus]|nr:hypothetical protein SHL15_8976 [Streptomyces hygroscopicus subsp. limoneus]